jgi:hypothetical protein
MNMFGQQRAKNRQSLPQEGIVELSDEQLEAVSGGDMSEATRQALNIKSKYMYTNFVEQSLQYEYQTRLQRGTLGEQIVVPKRTTTDPHYRG